MQRPINDSNTVIIIFYSFLYGACAYSVLLRVPKEGHLAKSQLFDEHVPAETEQQGRMNMHSNTIYYIYIGCASIIIDM